MDTSSSSELELAVENSCTRNQDETVTKPTGISPMVVRFPMVYWLHSGREAGSQLDKPVLIVVHNRSTGNQVRSV